MRGIAPTLLAVQGCAELTAAKIVAETAGVNRFKSVDAFACHAGVTPIPAWSGGNAGRVRFARSGNRQLNAALHRIAVVQIRDGGPSSDYYRGRLAGGDSRAKGLRWLKRKLARVVFGRLGTDSRNREHVAESGEDCGK